MKTSRRPSTILCIDDDASGLLVRKMLLESQGYDVLLAESGEQGLGILAKSKVDAVVLDYRMPSMSGAEVARHVRQRWPNLPIVLLSGYPGDVPDDALHLVDAFVTKGGTPEQFLEVLEGALKGQDFGRVTILNVDDDDKHRYGITRVLRKAGFDVIEARTGREALEMATSKPSLIILDIHLPDIMGLDVCRQLKADPTTSHIPVIHISATYPAREVIKESERSGAGLFLEHPENLAEVVHVVHDELRRVGYKTPRLQVES